MFDRGPGQPWASSRSLVVGIHALAVLSLSAPPAAAAMRVATGSYTGDGSPGRAIDSVGFPPDLVIVRGDLDEPTVVRTADMPPDAAKPLGGSFPLRAGSIVSFDATGFTVGSDATANSPGVTYYWAAFQAAPGEMAVGSYVGDGTDDRSITGLGIAPAYVIAMNAAGLDAMQRYSGEIGDRSLPFQDSDEKSDRIQALESDGFQVGKSPTVNQLDKTVYYAAWSAASPGVSCGVYTGNAVDDRAITEAGFPPACLLLARRGNGSPTVQRMESMPVDLTLAADKDAGFADGIQRELPNGFEIGGGGAVNSDGEDYLWVAIRSSVSLDLVVDKSADRAEAEVGDIITYTVSLLNQGADDATGIIVSEDFPAGMTLLSAVPSHGQYAESDSLWRVDRVAPGETATLSLNMLIRLEAAGTVVVNAAALIHVNEIDTSPDNNRATVSVAVRGADLAVGKQVAPAKPNEGDPVLYTVTVSNLGPDGASGVTVTDLLPPEVTYTGHATAMGSYDGASGEWEVGSLAVGQSAILSIDALVNTGIGSSTVVNLAGVSASDAADPDTTNNEGAASFGPLSADLDLTKAVDTAFPSERDTLVYTITVTNAGPDTATSVTAVDPMPAGLSYLSDEAGQGAYSPSTGLWSIGTIPPGLSATLRIFARVGEGTTGSTRINSAAIVSSLQADPDNGNNADEVAVTVRGVDIAVSKSASNVSPREGDEIVFRIRVGNAGPDTATSVTVLDLLPPGVAFLADSLGQGVYEPTSGLWSLGPLPPGTGAMLAVTASVDPGTAGTAITNTAALVGSEPADIDPLDDASSITVHVRKADLALAKSASAAWVSEGDTLVYTLRLTNLGPDDASSVTVAEPLPDGTSFVSGVANRGTYDSAAGLWSVGDVANGATLTLTMAVSVNAGTGGSVLTNTATLSGSMPVDDETANNFAAVSTPVRLADLALTKTVNSPSFPAGGMPIFTITLRNAGPDSVSGAIVADPLPAGLSHILDAATRGYFLPASGSWIVGDLAPGDSASLTITTLVNAGTAGLTIINAASVASMDETDPDPTNDSGSASILILRDETAELSLSKQVDNAVPNVGSTLSYTLHLANAGPDTATGLAITDRLPDGLTYTASASSRGTYSPDSGVWTVGTLPPGGSATLGLGATVNRGTAGLAIANTASVTARDQIDTYHVNDAATAVITVQAADLTLTKEVSRGTAAPGDTLSYTITLDNAGPSDATGVRIVDSLPVGSILVDAWVSHGSLEPTGLWDVGALAPAGTASAALRVRIDPGYGGVLIRNVVAVDAVDQEDPHPGSEADTAITVLPAADLSLQVSVSDPEPVEGDLLTCTVDLSNAGPDAAADVKIAVSLPAGILFVSAAPSAGAYDPATGLWDPGALAPYTMGTLILEIMTGAGTAGDTLVVAAGIAATDRDDPDPDDNRDSVSLVPQYPLLVTADAQSGTPLLPGAASKEVLHMKVINRSAAVVTLTALTLSNTATGAGTPTQLDQSWSMLSLVAEGAPETGSPPQTGFSSGVATFRDLLLVVPARGDRNLSIRGGASLTARDDDALDLEVTGPGDILFADGAQASAEWPLDPSGAFPVDGMTSAQIAREDVASGTVLRGERRRLALDATIPPNGYEADIWRGLSIVNLGDADPEADIRSITIWRDGGNRRFDGGSPDDIYLGNALWHDDHWELGSFWRPLPTTGLRIFAAVDVDTMATPGRTIRLEIPLNGVTVESDNDGPIDGSVSSDATLVIAASPSEVVLASAEAQTSGDLLPGGTPETLFRLHLYNNSETVQVLTRVAFASAASGPGTQAQLDADWSGLSLMQDLPEGVAGILLGAASMSAGAIEFSGFSLPIPVEGEITLSLRGGASLLARDGDRLDLLIPGAMSFGFAQEVPVLGSWPLDPPGSFMVDGMAAAQITLHPVKPGNLAAGSRRILLLDVVLPPNGYETDLLTRLNLVNLGSAQPGIDISKLEAWRDDGSGSFSVAEDRVIGSLSHTGDRWEVTGLAEPVPLGGLRVFVTADIAELATEGRTLQLQIPAVKDVGVGMMSYNDGPRDRPVVNPESAAITTANRITLSATPLPGGVTHPGAGHVPLLRLAATNTYDATRTVSRLAVTNVSRRDGVHDPATDDAVQSVDLRLDANENGILDGPSVDPVLSTALFLANRADFDGLAWELASGRTQYLFVSAAVSMTSASDGDVLGATIDALRDVTFDEGVTVAAGWPVDSGGRWTVDGMVAAQIGVFGTGSATIGPGEGPVPVFDFVVPADGRREDLLHGVQVSNLGSAGPSEIGELRLWSDGGDGQLSSDGDDIDLGPVTWTGQGWSSPVLHMPIPPGGLRLLLAMTASPSLAAGATVRLAVPLNGITVESGNDGPVDEPVASGHDVLLSAAPLLSSLETVPRTVTVDQTFAVRMAVRNRGDETIVDVTPSSLVVQGEATPVLVTGPDRSGFSLTPSAADTITWVYRAIAPGAAEFVGLASGRGEPSDIAIHSLESTSNTLRAYVGAGSLELYPVGPRSMSVTRGQTGLVPLSLTLLNPGSSDASDIRLRRLRMRLEDETGAALAPGSIVSRLVVGEGSRVYATRSQAELIGGGMELDLVLTPPVLITNSEPTTLNLQLDIADDAAAQGFRVAILDSTWFDAEDATGGAPVGVALRSGGYPLRSGFVRLGIEATSVRIRGEERAEVRAGRGQGDVRLLEFTIESPGVDGLTMDARFGGMAVVLLDADGKVIRDPERVLDRVSLRSPLKLLDDRRVSADMDGVIRLTFTGFLSLPVNAPVALSLDVDVAATAEAAVYRLRLADPSTVDAWEPSSLETLPAQYENGVIEGAPLRVERPAECLAAAGDPCFPAAITVGSRDALALRGTLHHPGTPGTAAIRVDTLTVRCWNRERNPLPSGSYFERLSIRRGGVDAATTAVPPGWSGPVVIPIGGWLLEPGASIDFDLLSDVDPRAPASSLELVVGSTDICAVDANTLRRVAVQADLGAQLPLYSGLVRLEAPPRELLVGLTSLLPPALAPDGREVAVATLTFANPAPEGSGPVRIDHLVVQAADRQLRRASIGATAERVGLYRNGEPWVTGAALTPDSTTAWIAFPEPIVVDSETEAAIEVRAVIRAGTASPNVRFGWEDSGIGIIQPEGTLLTVAVRTRDAGGFPLWTASGELGPGTLRESYSNFPNPFAAGRERTAFVFYLPTEARVFLKVWTLRGEPVVTLLDGERRPPGLRQEDLWDGRNGRGDTVWNGVYIAELVVRFDDGKSERLLRKVAVVR